MQMMLTLLFLLNCQIQSSNLYFTILLLLACFMVPVEMINLMPLAWWIENVAKNIPKNFWNRLFMVKMDTLDMPGLTMAGLWKRMALYMIIEMLFLTVHLCQPSKFLFYSLFFLFFFNNNFTDMIVISMWRSVLLWMLSSTSTNTFIKDMIGPL